MRSITIVALISALQPLTSYSAPGKMATCIRSTAYITASSGRVVNEKYPCIVTDPNKVNFDGGGAAGDSSPPAGSWVANLPENDTGAIYVGSADEAGAATANFRYEVRGLKPYVDGASLLGSLFAEPLASYQQAALNRNESVDSNLSKVRGAATRTSADLAQAKAARTAGLPEVSSELKQLLNGRLQQNDAASTSATAAASNMSLRLARLPKLAPPIDLASVSGRAKLPSEITRAVAQTIDQRSTVGITTLLGNSKPGQGLANAADLELREYERLKPNVRSSSRVREGVLALAQAKYFATRNSVLAHALFAEGRSIRAFAAGETKVDEVAAWDPERKQFVMVAPSGATNRALAIAVTFSRQTTTLQTQIHKAGQGALQRPPDSALRTTEQIVAQAEAQLDSDPVKSLGGLFRARTLLQNMELYGGAWIKLNRWGSGAAKRLREAFTPPSQIGEPGGFGKYIATDVSKKLKDSLATYLKAVDAGDYTAIGIDKVQDLFGSDTLTELKQSLRDAIDAAKAEAAPLSGLDRVAPTVELWVLSDARAANESNSKAEVAELMKLRNLYTGRVRVLKTYEQRLGALSELASIYSIALDSSALWTLASVKCFSTACAGELMALSEQLSDVRYLSRDAGEETRRTLERYNTELTKLDQLIDSWLLVLPDPSPQSYRDLSSPARNLRNLYP